MQKALEIPGGVVDTVDARNGAAATIKAVPDEQIRSLRVAATHWIGSVSHS